MAMTAALSGEAAARRSPCLSIGRPRPAADVPRLTDPAAAAAR